jgi:gamma-glutamyltranspeptidase
MICRVYICGGIWECKLTATDYKCKWNTPISARYRDYMLWTAPAPASGAIWLSAMGTLSNFPSAGAGTVLDIHRVTEALRVSLRPPPPEAYTR